MRSIRGRRTRQERGEETERFVLHAALIQSATLRNKSIAYAILFRISIFTNCVCDLGHSLHANDALESNVSQGTCASIILILPGKRSSAETLSSTLT